MVSFSQPSAHTPKINPNRLNDTEIKTRNSNMMAGCAILMSTKKLAVDRMMPPMMMDFVAAAPT